MNGITAYDRYLPRHRLNGTRVVASYDEDSTTMGVEAARRLPPADAIYLATTSPAYFDKTNAAAIHAALGRGPEGFAADLAGSARSAIAAYEQAGVSDPRTEISLAEVHDCFTPTELVLMEDLGFAERGQAWRDGLDGAFELGGRLPVNPDGGLKSFGHPVGASGLRMLYECWLQFRGEAGERQLEDPCLALTHNLGGRPGACVSFVSVLGR